MGEFSRESIFGFWTFFFKYLKSFNYESHLGLPVVIFLTCFLLISSCVKVGNQFDFYSRTYRSELKEEFKSEILRIKGSDVLRSKASGAPMFLLEAITVQKSSNPSNSGCIVEIITDNVGGNYFKNPTNLIIDLNRFSEVAKITFNKSNKSDFRIFISVFFFSNMKTMVYDCQSDKLIDSKSFLWDEAGARVLSNL